MKTLESAIAVRIPKTLADDLAYYRTLLNRLNALESLPEASNEDFIRYLISLGLSQVQNDSERLEGVFARPETFLPAGKEG